MPAKSRVQRSTLFLPTAQSTGAGPAMVAAAVFADPSITGPRIVCFAFPGGGYTKEYFDLHHPDLTGPSQAEYHAEQGAVFVACDPFGGGQSTRLVPGKLGLSETATAFHSVTASVLDRLRAGTLLRSLAPMQVSTCIGVGHSLGGMQLIAQQALYASFDAVAILGFSAIHTTIPSADGHVAPHGDEAGSLDSAWAGPLVDDLSHLRRAYHWDDVSPAIVREDMSVGFPVRTAEILPPWISDSFPPFAATCMAPGVVADEAARITVPVFVGAGERDVIPDLHAEAAAYGASRDVTLVEVPRSAHMHNFSPQRVILWARLQHWLTTVDSLVEGRVYAERLAGGCSKKKPLNGESRQHARARVNPQ